MPEPNKRSALRQNLIFAGLLLALALGLLALRAFSGPGLTARVDTTEGQIDLSLTADGVYDLPSGGATIHLEVKDGAIRFIDSPCPDHLCEGFGWLAKPDDWAACIPCQAAVTVLEPD